MQIFLGRRLARDYHRGQSNLADQNLKQGLSSFAEGHAPPPLSPAYYPR